MPDILTRVDLDAKIGATRVTNLIDDSFNGTVDGDEIAFLDTIMEEAEGLAIGWLLAAGYTEEATKLLADNDRALKGNIAWMACELLSERKTEFTSDDGWGAYRVQYERAEKYFEALSRGRRRSKGEKQAGANAQIGGQVTPSPPAGTARQHQFAPNKHSPNGRGGF